MAEMATTSALALAAPQGAGTQGHPWDDATEVLLDYGSRYSTRNASIGSMNQEMKRTRDIIFLPEGPRPAASQDFRTEARLRSVRDLPYVDISLETQWRGYIANHTRKKLIVGSGIVWAGWVAILDEHDQNHHTNTVELLLADSDGVLVRMHPRIASNGAQVVIRIGRFRGHFSEWEGCDRVALSTLASPQGSAAAPPPPPPSDVSRSGTDSSMPPPLRYIPSRMPAPPPPAHHLRCHPRYLAARDQVPHPWVAYFDEDFPEQQWVHNPDTDEAAWFFSHGCILANWQDERRSLV